MLRSLSIGIFLASAVHILGADSTSLTAIGLVRASGEFTIDSSATRDNSTVFDGSVISTTQASSHVVLEDGTHIDMGLDSRSRIYRDHITIEQGLVHINTANRYAIIAGRIRIDSPQRTLVRVDSRTVAVSALQEVTEVKDGKGMLIARVSPGRTLDFSQAKTSSSDTHVRGCLQRIESKSGDHTTVHYVLLDQVTNVIVELVGNDLDRFVRRTVEATGSIDSNTKAIPPAAYIIRLGSVTSASQQTCVRGCLQRIESKSGGHTTVHYVLQDQVANVVVELVGPDLDRFVNRTVEATGSIDSNTKAISPAAYILRLGNVTSASQQTCAAPPGAARGLSMPAKVGIIGGVAAAGTLGGLAAAGVIGGGAAATSPAPASR